MTRATGALRLALVAAVAVAAMGCEDSIIKMLGPENSEFITNEGGTFRHVSYELDNVTDRRVFQWDNPMPRAMVEHRNFVHHGSVLILVKDADSTVVDSVFAEWEMDAPTDVGTPGTWTLEFRYFGARGRVDTRFVPLAAE